jgi:hypothetical protein
VQRFATSLMRQYDTNKNGMLEPDEWRTMRGNPQEADKNGDGKISLDELTDRMASFGQRRGDGGGDGPGNPPASPGDVRTSRGSPGGPSSSAGGKLAAVSPLPSRPRRYVTPAGRLPEGLPTWFNERDADGDGQVAMAEYATSWTEAKAAEFSSLDRNGDGLISPQEALDKD